MQHVFLLDVPDDKVVLAVSRQGESASLGGGEGGSPFLSQHPSLWNTLFEYAQMLCAAEERASLPMDDGPRARGAPDRGEHTEGDVVLALDFGASVKGPAGRAGAGGVIVCLKAVQLARAACTPLPATAVASPSLSRVCSFARVLHALITEHRLLNTGIVVIYQHQPSPSPGSYEHVGTPAFAADRAGATPSDGGGHGKHTETRHAAGTPLYRSAAAAVGGGGTGASSAAHAAHAAEEEEEELLSLPACFRSHAEVCVWRHPPDSRLSVVPYGSISDTTVVIAIACRA